MVKDIYGISLRNIIPPSIADDPQVQAIIDALDPELQSVSFDTREALIYSRIDELPEDVVDSLAWQLHVDFYELGLALEAKRGLVKTSILVHMRKGTKWAVQELCDTVFGETTVQAWFEYEGLPYHFRVLTEANLPTTEAWKKFFYALEVTKSVRDWLDAIQIHRKTSTTLYYGHGMIVQGSIALGIYMKSSALGTGCRVGIGSALRGIMKILAEEVI